MASFPGKVPQQVTLHREPLQYNFVIISSLMLETGCTSTAVLHQTELQLGHLLESVLEKSLKKLFLCFTTEVYVLIANLVMF